MPSLESTINSAARSATPTQAFRDGETRPVDIDQLDENPFQPRVKMDAGELDELAGSIRANGLIQAIVVRPTTNGRFVIVAGHRRVSAFRKLRESAAEGEKSRFSFINAQLRLALDDVQLAAMAYAENVTRANLTPVEEGRALERWVDAGLARTNEDLAALTSQPVAKIRRLRRIGKAPKFIKDAIDTGFVVATGKGADGAPVEERRRLELMAGLQFIALFEHLQKEKPKKAEERALAAVRRSLASNWSLRRTEEFVQGVVAGKQLIDDAAADEAGPRETAVFERSARRFVVDLSRLAVATDQQLEALRAAFEGLVEERAAKTLSGGDHQ